MPRTISHEAAHATAISAAQLNACAGWNEEAAATAYQQGDIALACRLWAQANELRATSAKLSFRRGKAA